MVEAFIPYYKAILEILETSKELKKMAKGIAKQVALGATGTVIGGLVGGPPGAFVCGCAGMAVGYAISNDYSSMLTIIKNLTDAEKKELVKLVKKLVTSDSVEMLKTFVLVPLNQKLLYELVEDFAKCSGQYLQK